MAYPDLPVTITQTLNGVTTAKQSTTVTSGPASNATSLTSALQQVGVAKAAVSSLGQAIDQFALQNVTPSKLTAAARSIGAGGGIPTFKGAAGEWTAVHYADDLIDHAPKFKFLFKVTFEGFDDRQFQFFVHRCDKPKVNFNHTDVNYYNFRSKVLTSTTFQPLNMTLLDETGNSVNTFFVNYLAKMSGQGSAGWGVEAGFGVSSSTKPYEANYGYSNGKKVIIEQIFANGIYSNAFELINPRIEAFDFDELNMEDSSSGSMLNLIISYDALKCDTIQFNDFATWGNTDLRRGGGTSGIPNAGQSSVFGDGVQPVQSATGAGMNGPSPISQPNSALNGLTQLPAALQGLAGGMQELASLKPRISSAGDVLSKNVSDTINNVKNSFQFNV